MTVEALELFRSEALLVREICGFNSQICVITFDSYSDRRTLDRSGFAEDFLVRHGLDAIHVVSADNDWYLYPEMEAATRVIAQRVRSYEKVLTYGSSMGGYAAIRFGRMAGASTAIAISPQFSIDKTIAPFEDRWPESSVLDFSLERNAQPFVENACIIYDPRSIDRGHVELFRAHTQVTDVAIPYSGHPASGFLNQVGLLKSAILDAIHGQLDACALVREARRRRRQSPDYFMTLAAASSNPNRQVALSSQAVALSNGSPGYQRDLALYLGQAGRHEEARALFQTLMAAETVALPVFFAFCAFQEATGDIAGAIRTLERLLEMQPSAKIVRARRDANIAKMEARAAAEASRKRRQRFRWLLGLGFLAHRGQRK